jgi:hypothetical protein
VLADARPAALLALASLAVVLADARPAALLARALISSLVCIYFIYIQVVSRDYGDISLLSRLFRLRLTVNFGSLSFMGIGNGSKGNTKNEKVVEMEGMMMMCSLLKEFKE